MQYVPIILSAVSGLASLSQGRQAAALAQAQAEQERTLATLRAHETLAVAELESANARIQATRERLAHEREATNVVRDIARVQAAIRARAAAGGVRAFEGSAEATFAEAGFAGAREFDISKENAALAEEFGFMQAQLISSTAKGQAAYEIALGGANASSIEQQGKAAKTAAFGKAASYFGEAIYRGYKLSTPGEAKQPQPKKADKGLLGNFEWGYL